MNVKKKKGALSYFATLNAGDPKRTQNDLTTQQQTM